MAGNGRVAGTLLRTFTKMAESSPSPTPVRGLTQSSVLLPPVKETTYPEASPSCQKADKYSNKKNRKHNFRPDPLPIIQNERQRHHSLSPDENPCREFRILEGEKMSVDEAINSKWNFLRWALEEDGTMPKNAFIKNPFNK